MTDRPDPLDGRYVPARALQALLDRAQCVAGLPAPTTAADVLRARRGRDRFLPPKLFGEPGWDMLLDLYHHAGKNRRVSVSSLTIAAAVPPTTGLRWIGRMTAMGVVNRVGDPRDHRRAWIGLPDHTMAGLRDYFAWLNGPAR